MATESFRMYRTRFREGATENGLRYTASHAFSSIPLAVGHFIDTTL